MKDQPPLYLTWVMYHKLYLQDISRLSSREGVVNFSRYTHAHKQQMPVVIDKISLMCTSGPVVGPANGLNDRPTYLPIYRRTYLPTKCLPACLPTYLSTNQPNTQPTSDVVSFTFSLTKVWRRSPYGEAFLSFLFLPANYRNEPGKFSLVEWWTRRYHREGTASKRKNPTEAGERT